MRRRPNVHRITASFKQRHLHETPYEEAVEDVLPTELLGWLLLRRAGLTTQSRLAVQAVAGRSLRFEVSAACKRS